MSTPVLGSCVSAAASCTDQSAARLLRYIFPAAANPQTGRVVPSYRASTCVGARLASSADGAEIRGSGAAPRGRRARSSTRLSFPPAAWCVVGRVVSSMRSPRKPGTRAQPRLKQQQLLSAVHPRLPLSDRRLRSVRFSLRTQSALQAAPWRAAIRIAPLSLVQRGYASPCNVCTSAEEL